jgi:hypothetical protein
LWGVFQYRVSGNYLPVLTWNHNPPSLQWATRAWHHRQKFNDDHTLPAHAHLTDLQLIKCWLTGKTHGLLSFWIHCRALCDLMLPSWVEC